MIVFDSGNACIMQIEARNYVYIAVEGMIKSETAKLIGEKLIEVCSTMNAPLLLIDSSKLGIVSTQYTNWLIENVLPKLREYKILKTAFLLPENAFALLSINKIIGEIQVSQKELFYDMLSAEKWLFSEN